MIKCNDCSTIDVKYFLCENCYKNKLNAEKVNFSDNGKQKHNRRKRKIKKKLGRYGKRLKKILS